jgi:hypothetical protein
VANHLNRGVGLEAALASNIPPDSVEAWIVKQTCALLLPRERSIMNEVVKGSRTLRLTTFLSKILKPATGLPILTTNYDRLVEVACEMVGMHVDTTAVGHYAAAFDHERSCMGSARKIGFRGKTQYIDHFPRAVVLKPHGSFDWYRNGSGAIRCSTELVDADRLIITPGLNKYKAGYDAPFDKHRELANNHINRAARLLIIGYGFNDDHLQTHLVKRIREGVPTLIMTRTASAKAQELAAASPNCLCLSKPAESSGVSVIGQGTLLESADYDMWDLDVLAREFLG